MRCFRITVEGIAYDVSVEELDAPAHEESRLSPPAGSAAPTVGTPAPVRPRPPERSEAAPAAPGDVVSPLAGVIVSLGVDVGRRVEVGEPLLILEAMKMQTTISAPRAGTVGAIAVAAGAAVQEGQVLMTLR